MDTKKNLYYPITNLPNSLRIKVTICYSFMLFICISYVLNGFSSFVFKKDILQICNFDLINRFLNCFKLSNLSKETLYFSLNLTSYLICIVLIIILWDMLMILNKDNKKFDLIISNKEECPLEKTILVVECERDKLQKELEATKEYAINLKKELDMQIAKCAQEVDKELIATRKELENERCAHAKTRSALEKLVCAVGLPNDWDMATEIKYPPLARVVGWRLQGVDDKVIALHLADEKAKNSQHEDVSSFSKSQIDALVTAQPLANCSQAQIGTLLDKEGGAKTMKAYLQKGKRLLGKAK